MNSRFRQPENLDTPIWRYMSVAKFVSMLQNGGLFFSWLPNLDDRNEGLFPNQELNIQAQTNSFMRRAKIPEKQRANIKAQVRKILDTNPNFCTVSCWNLAEKEDLQLWNQYGGGHRECVVILSTFRRLRAAVLNHKCADIGIVHYLDRKNEWLLGMNCHDAYMCKDNAFAGEQEVRAIHWIGSDDVEEMEQEGGKWLSIELQELVGDVRVHPHANEWFLALVKQLLVDYELGIPCDWSELRI